MRAWICLPSARAFMLAHACKIKANVSNFTQMSGYSICCKMSRASVNRPSLHSVLTHVPPFGSCPSLKTLLILMGSGTLLLSCISLTNKRISDYKRRAQKRKLLVHLRLPFMFNEVENRNGENGRADRMRTYLVNEMSVKFTTHLYRLATN
eukprot:Gb_16372 [translate_table: standard]